MSENTKNTENVVIEEETLQETANLFFESARKAMNAGLGAVDLAREEVTNLLEKTQVDIEEIFNNLVARGESFGADNRQRFDEAVNTRKAKAEETVKNILYSDQADLISWVPFSFALGESSFFPILILLIKYSIINYTFMIDGEI